MVQVDHEVVVAFEHEQPFSRVDPFEKNIDEYQRPKRDIGFLSKYSKNDVPIVFCSTCLRI